VARRHRQDPESGQATTEFALILIPLLILVVGIIQFGIGLNYWLDMNRLANQGARWAVVNGWPTCPRTQLTPCGQSLAAYVKSQTATSGLNRSVTVMVCYPDDGDGSPGSPNGEVGDPVKVQLDSPYTFRAIMKLGTINLRARATMRIETKEPVDHLTGALNPCP
jgi:hypothetical protein